MLQESLGKYCQTIIAPRVYILTLVSHLYCWHY